MFTLILYLTSAWNMPTLEQNFQILPHSVNTIISAVMLVSFIAICQNFGFGFCALFLKSTRSIW